MTIIIVIIIIKIIIIIVIIIILLLLLIIIYLSIYQVIFPFNGSQDKVFWFGTILLFYYYSLW